MKQMRPINRLILIKVTTVDVILSIIRPMGNNIQVESTFEIARKIGYRRTT